MLNLRKVVVACLASSLFMVIPAYAQGVAGCKNGKFIGSYTNVIASPDIWGDGSNVEHQVIDQLTLHSDGTARADFTGAPDTMLSFGSSSPAVGSWTCRNDGMLVVTLIHADYVPTTDAINHPSTVQAPPPVDLILVEHVRSTSLFSVTDANTLTRTQFRRRVYDPTQDPTDPTGGILGPLNTNVIVYKRLVASDADLLAP